MHREIENGSSETTITDQFGEIYRLQCLVDSSLLRWEIWHQDDCIAYANGLGVGNVFQLQDIRFGPPRTPRRTLLDRILFRPPKPVDFRRRGLGTVLLTQIIKCAEDRGFESIIGQIVEGDVANNPKLIPWYQKHGFGFTPRAENPFAGAIQRQLATSFLTFN